MLTLTPEAQSLCTDLSLLSGPHGRRLTIREYITLGRAINEPQRYYAAAKDLVVARDMTLGACVEAIRADEADVPSAQTLRTAIAFAAR
jgi:hypothetical protein